MRTMSIRTGADPATTIGWRDTADIVLIPLDAFGWECIEQAQYLDSTLWGEEKRLCILHPGASEERANSLPALTESPDRIEKKLTHFFNAEATPEGDVDHCILVGSLLERASADWSALFFRVLFSDPRLLHLWRASAFWACSGTTSTLEYDQYPGAMDHAMTILGHIMGLYDSADVAWRKDTPQVIVGRAATADSPLLPRDESALVVALGLLCRIYEIRGQLSQPSMVPTYNITPFFSTTSTTKATTPFVHFGASLIASYPSLLARAASAELSRCLLEKLAQQAKPESELGPRLDDSRRDLTPVLEQAARDAMAEAGRIAHIRKLASTDGGLSVDWLARELGRTDLMEKWKEQIEENFGWERIETLPLESWDQSLQELDSLTTRFFEDQMASFLKRFEGEWIAIFQEGTIRVLGEVVAGEILSNEGSLRPNLMARSVLYYLKKQIEEGRRDDQKARSEEDDRSAVDEIALDLEKYPAQIQEHLLRLKKSLRSIPSHLAFYARVSLIFAVVFVLGDWLNFAGNTGFPLEHHFLINTGIGLIAALALVFYLGGRMRSLKKDLEKKYDKYLTLVGEYHEHRFRLAARQSRALIWDLSALWCEWVADPASPDQRSSLLDYIKGRKGQDDKWPAHLQDALHRITPETSIHAYLHDYKDTLPKAAQHCNTLVEAALRAFSGTRRKLQLPPFDHTKEGIAHFRTWLLQKKLILGVDTDTTTWCTFLGDLAQRIPAKLGDRILSLYAKTPRTGTAGDPPEWQIDLTAQIDLPAPTDFSRGDDYIPPPFQALVKRFLDHPEVSHTVEALIDIWCYQHNGQTDVLDPNVTRRLGLCDPYSPSGTRIQRCALVPTAHRITDTISSDKDRTFTVASLRYFGFLSVARDIPLVEVQGNFSITKYPGKGSSPKSKSPTTAKGTKVRSSTKKASKTGVTTKKASKKSPAKKTNKAKSSETDAKSNAGKKSTTPEAPVVKSAPGTEKANIASKTNTASKTSEVSPPPAPEASDSRHRSDPAPESTDDE